MTSLQYFSKFLITALLDIVVEQTNIYSFQTIHKSINPNRAEMFLTAMSIKMGILRLPSYKIRPLISMVRDESVKIEHEEYNLVDKQIIPLKTNYLSIRQYNPKKPKKTGGSKILFVLASLVLCMTFSFIMGKTMQS